jgi:hypothetical protein
MVDPQDGYSEEAPDRRQKGRSPSYPGISLATAVERARALYERERKNAAPMAAITAAWGYKSPTTGPASVSYSALKKFGLLVEDKASGHRVGRLTPLALEILLNPNNADAIRKAALLPPIYREMWEEYGNDLPSNETLRWQLVAQRGFTETGFEEFVRGYRETLVFAQLDAVGKTGQTSDPVLDEDDDDGPLQEILDPSREKIPSEPAVRTLPVRQYYQEIPERTVPANVLRMPVRLVGGATIYLEGEFPISEAGWKQFLAVLEAMKPGLVAE